MAAVDVSLSGWAEWPRTQFDAEKEEFLITGLYEPAGSYELHPAWFIMLAGNVFFWTAILWPDTRGMMVVPWFWLGVEAAVLTVFYFAAWKPLMKWLHGGTVRVVVTKKNVVVERRWRKQTLPRSDGLEILREQHQKGQLFERGVKVTNGAHYRGASEVVIRYVDQRAVVAAMAPREIEKATALTLRLQVVVFKFEALAAAFGGVSAGPAETEETMR
ncbi:hypothetical protein [Hyphomicrobium sp. MC8b]|uniref:hypothetical protein n=1 Tax=Hyphomicrobium sp. MC8b TaxID=300273 RepID=UPI00391931F0